MPVILDSLVTGRREFTAGRTTYEGDIADGPLVDRIFAEHSDIGAVIHCAALIVVPDSVADPVGYYRANVAASLEFAAHLLRNGCGRLIFSSSAAIYRAGADLSVDEDSPVVPASPYARTKAVCEAMFADIAGSQPIRVLSLRYFNPIGADPKMRTGLQLPRPTHALGKMILAQQDGVPFVITGTDWPTRDGSGLRDYVHVWDLASAHVAALTRFDALPGPATAINLGTGTGTTVRELLAAFNQVTGHPIEVREAGRRAGDAAGACTRIDRAERLLGWRPQYDLAEGIRHSLQWAALRDGILPGSGSGPLRELDVGQDAVVVGAGHSYGADHRHGGGPGHQDMIQAHDRERGPGESGPGPVLAGVRAIGEACRQELAERPVIPGGVEVPGHHVRLIDGRQHLPDRRQLTPPDAGVPARGSARVDGCARMDRGQRHRKAARRLYPRPRRGGGQARDRRERHQRPARPQAGARRAGPGI